MRVFPFVIHSHNCALCGILLYNRKQNKRQFPQTPLYIPFHCNGMRLCLNMSWNSFCCVLVSSSHSSLICSCCCIKRFLVVGPSSLISSVHFRFFSLQVPTPLSPQRRRFLAMKWLITAAREQQKNKNKNARMYKKLAKELIDAYNSEVR